MTTQNNRSAHLSSHSNAPLTESESEVVFCTDVVILYKLAHGLSRDRRRVWIMRKWQSSLGFHTVTHCDHAHQE